MKTSRQIEIEQTGLVQWDSIKSAIANSQDIIAMSKLNYSLDAVQQWAKQSKQSLETQNEIAEYRLRLNRKQGEWIIENIPEEGGNPTNQLTENSQLIRPTLAEAGIDRNDSPKFRALAKLPVETFERHIAEIKFQKEELTTRGILAIAHVFYNSGENEWYTPQKYITASRETMGSIDLDPASSDVANQTVQAAAYYTIEQDGLISPWFGNVWLNPPYSQPLIAKFASKLTECFTKQIVSQACVLVNNATETDWFQTILAASSAECFIKGRVKFLNSQGQANGAPLQGQVVLYLGEKTDLFTKNFGSFGIVRRA